MSEGFRKLKTSIKVGQSYAEAKLRPVGGITADTALRLAKYFGNSPKFWLGLQDDFDLEEGRDHLEVQLAEINQLQYNVG